MSRRLFLTQTSLLLLLALQSLQAADEGTAPKNVRRCTDVFVRDERQASTEADQEKALSDPTPANPSEDITASASEPTGTRRTTNDSFIGVPLRTHVAQRFEMYSPRTEAAVKELKEMGFTQVMLDRPNLHQAATDAGLPFVLAHWWNQDTKPEEIAAAVERAGEMDRSMLIGFSTMDEPERNSPETPFGYYIDVYEKLKPRFQQDFPDTRLEISHWGPLADWSDQHYEYFSFLYEAADVMRIMPYPDLNEGPLDEVFFMTQRTRRLMELANRNLPLVVILQTWILPPKNQLPEIAELRVMTYQAMLSGAETVSYFDHNPEVWKQSEGFEDQYRALMKEVTTFAREYRDWDVESVMSSDGILTSILTSPVGRQLRVTINTQRKPVSRLAALEVHRYYLDSLSPLQSGCTEPFKRSSAVGSICVRSSHDTKNRGRCSRRSAGLLRRLKYRPSPPRIRLRR